MVVKNMVRNKKERLWIILLIRSSLTDVITFFMIRFAPNFIERPAALWQDAAMGDWAWLLMLIHFSNMQIQNEVNYG
jgi:hypothetical protein